MNDYQYEEQEESISQEPRYKWNTPEDAGDFSTMVLKHIVHLLEMYPNLDATIMMSALNALSYQVDTEERYNEAIRDINDLSIEQILKHMPESEIVGKA